MSVCGFFYFCHVGHGLVRGPVQGVLPTVCKIHSFRLILRWEQTRGSNPSREEEEEQEDEGGGGGEGGEEEDIWVDLCISFVVLSIG
jgi:hypothetical protein